MIETRNRKLEQFYFLHGVDYVRWRKDDEGLTVWEYEDNEENRRIHEEFRLAIKRREAQREQAENEKVFVQSGMKIRPEHRKSGQLFVKQSFSE